MCEPLLKCFIGACYVSNRVRALHANAAVLRAAVELV